MSVARIIGFLLFIPLWALQAQDDVSVELISTTEVTCGGGSDGTITVKASGGTGKYTFLLLRSTFPAEMSAPINSDTYTFTGHVAYDSYLVIVSDEDPINTADGYLWNIPLGAPDPISITSYGSTNISCNGLSDGTISVSAEGESGNYNFTLSGDASQVSTSGMFTALGAGNYLVTVQDQNGCPSTDVTPTLTINDPNPITITVDQTTHVLCNGESTGSISITPSGGTPGAGGYTYSWIGPGGFSSTSEDISGLAAGNYTVTVSDGNMCSSMEGPINLSEPTPLSATRLSSGNVSCNGGSDGSVQVSASGGVGAYTYTWIGQNTGFTTNAQDPTNLPADTYDLILGDGNGCTRTFTGFVSISEPALMAVSSVSTNGVTCPGGSDGSASISLSGGTPGYTYSWTGASTPYTSTGPNPINMPADDYSVRVTDANSCMQDFPNVLTITEPDPINVILNGSTDVSCNAGNDGSVSITISGGTPSFTLLWTGQNTGHSSNAEDPNDLVADVYDLLITDSNGCSAPFNDLVTIGEPAIIDVSVISVIPVNCFGTSTGAIEITPLGGTPLYTFAWSGPSGYTSNDEDITGLAAGTYSLRITDANGCFVDFPNLAMVGTNTALTASLDLSSDVTCPGGNDGWAQMTPGGGVGPYTFLWVGQNTGYTTNAQNPSNLPADTYDFTLTDALGCSDVFADFATLVDPPPIQVDVAGTSNVSCHSETDGSASITVTGGTPGYTFSWTGAVSGYSSGDQDPTGMPADTYTLEVTDGNSCPQEFPDLLNITEPDPILVILNGSSDVSCNGDSDGSASITITGGTPGYTIIWAGNSTGHTSNSADPTDLVADVYDLIITDANTCSVFLDDFLTIGEPAVLGVNLDLVTPVACFGDATGAIEITPTGGTGPFVFAWSGPDGFTSSAEDIGNLASGNYSLQITDDKGCFADFPNLATVGTATPITASFVITDVSCAAGASPDGAIDATVDGGTPLYTYAWSGPSGASFDTEDIINIPSGDWQLTVTDAAGCVETFLPQTVGSPNGLTATATATHIDCYGYNDGAINLEATGGTGTLVFSWTGPNGFTSSAKDLSGLGPGSYSVSITDDNLCTTQFPDIATVNENEQIEAQTVVQDITCHGAGDGAITLTPSGGTAPFTFDWSGSSGFTSNDQDLSNLGEGTYDLRITDNLGCFRNFPALARIDEPDPITAVLGSKLDILCHGDSSGSIFINTGGGVAPLIYVWTNADDEQVSMDEDPTGLPEGTYSLQITDAGGCTELFPDIATLTEPPALAIDLVLIEPSCAGGSNGSLSASGSGGVGPYQYSLDGGAYKTTGDFTGLSAGIHQINLLDANGCILPTSINLGEPAPILILTENATDISCNGAGDGRIQITAEGGTAPLSYTLLPGVVYSADGSFTNLDAGSYVVEVTDSRGCGPESTSSLEIIDPPILLVDSVQTGDISCFGSGDGSIHIFASGGTAPYEYSRDTMASWQTDSFFVDLQPGDYEIYVRDAGLCVIQTGQLTLNEPPALVFDSIITTNIEACAGDTTGEINYYGSGGTGLLFYSLDNTSYQDSGRFVHLEAGSYTLYLADETGCVITREVVLTEPQAISATVLKEDVSPGSKGSIRISDVIGGTPPYEYSIDGGSSFNDETEYMELESGSYHVIVRDIKGCTFERPVLILDFILLQVDLDLQNVSCFGADDGSIEFLPVDAEGSVEYSIDGGLSYFDEALFENLEGRTTYYLVAIDSVGKIFTDTVEITEPAPMIVNWSSTPAECNAYSKTGTIDVSVSGGAGAYRYIWSDGGTGEDRDSVAAGKYGLEILDENDCSWSDTLLVNAQVSVEVDAGTDTIICAGTELRLNGMGLYTPLWSNEEFLSSPDTLAPLMTGLSETTTFVLTITEEESIFACYNTDSVTIGVHPLMGIEVSPDTFIVRGGTAELWAESENLSAFSWEPAESLDNPNIANPLATPGESTMYTVTAINEYGCEESETVFVEVSYGVKAYNVFTPGGDGINDYFEIENGDKFPEMLVEVYSRWGDLLYSASGYDEGNLWDGYARGKPVPTGTYYYVIIPFPGANPVTGTVTVIWSEDE